MTREGAPQNGEQDFDAQGFLQENGIESLADRMVRGHDGEMMPLAEALATCEPARTSIVGAIEMAKDMGADDVLAPMTKYIDNLEKKAQDAEVKKK